VERERWMGSTATARSAEIRREDRADGLECSGSGRR